MFTCVNARNRQISMLVYAPKVNPDYNRYEMAIKRDATKRARVPILKSLYFNQRRR